MGIAEVVVGEIVKRLLNRRKSAVDAPYDPEQMRRHLVEVVNWSSRVEFAGLSTAHDTDSDTVALFTAVPRQFRGIAGTDTQSETSLLASRRNIAVLGDPGAGKTTTLKRLARLILQPPIEYEHHQVQVPVVIRLRELDDGNQVEEKLAEAFSLPHARITVPVPTKSEQTATIRIMVGIHSAISAIADTIDLAGACVMFDGLDEVKTGLRETTERVIEELARKCENALIILTCRSGDYRPLQGFDSVEICPLSESQIAAIIKRWCSKPVQFMSALRSLPFGDLATRPLFLCELIVLFERRGFLPTQPAAVYRRIVLLALEEWDRGKPVERQSRYADFDPERKLEFLASLAHHLTYVQQGTSFTPATLQTAYAAIFRDFGLPSHEAAQVWRELETHTGLTVQTGFEQYEFSHLSLQEFLTAHYLVRDNLGDDVVKLMGINAAPLAVSVALAANPSRRLAAILLARWDPEWFRQFNMPGFFSRLALEYARFGLDRNLGFAAVALMFAGHAHNPAIAAFLADTSVRRSCGEALLFYGARRRAGTDEIYDLMLSAGAVVGAATVARTGTLAAPLLLPLMQYCRLTFEGDETGVAYVPIGWDRDVPS